MEKLSQRKFGSDNDLKLTVFDTKNSVHQNMITYLKFKFFNQWKPLTANYITDPDPPRDLEIREIADEYATLVWNNPLSPVKSYKISYKKYGSTQWEVRSGIPAEKDILDHFGKSTKKTPNDEQLNGLEPGTNYIVKVEGLIVGGRHRNDFYSPPIEKSFWTEIDPVTALKSSKITLNSVQISWKKPKAKERDLLPVIHYTSGLSLVLKNR